MKKALIIILVLIAAVLSAGCVIAPTLDRGIIDINIVPPDVVEDDRVIYYADGYTLKIIFRDGNPYLDEPKHCSLYYTFDDDMHKTEKAFLKAAEPFFNHITIDSTVNGYPVGAIVVNERIESCFGNVQDSMYADWLQDWMDSL